MTELRNAQRDLLRENAEKTRSLGKKTKELESLREECESKHRVAAAHSEDTISHLQKRILEFERALAEKEQLLSQEQVQQSTFLQHLNAKNAVYTNGLETKIKELTALSDRYQSQIRYVVVAFWLFATA